MAQKCSWCLGNKLYEKYHDEEWGVTVHDDLVHFEFLLLESAQAGLSWLTILKKRENYRKAYDDFDYEKVSKYDEKKIEELMNNPGVVRNRRKIEASIKNAKVFIEIQNEFGSFDKYIWSFTDGKEVINHFKDVEEIPAKSVLSEIISKDLKKRGCSFLGPVIMYAYLQAVGIINDHIMDCFRYEEVQKQYIR
ncbi:MAG: DNA-3-methyladenine glycosylase I [Clostridiales bacterium]|nr:DNA-3-methyladenine glycosylase I [Clostridiales bacterium]